MAVLNSLMVWYIKKRMSQIDAFRESPIETQEKVFKYLIETAKNTTWGQEFDYQGISSWSDFNERVPVNDYDHFRPYIDRVRKGEKNVLWPTNIRYFSKSSGTTSDKSKYIPVSEECLKDCHYHCGKDMLAIYCTLFPETQIFTGKNLALGGSRQANEFGTDAFYGDLSAILIEYLPFWAERKRSPSKEVALMPEWEEKLGKMVELTSKDNIVGLSGVPSWMLILLKDILKYTGKQTIKEVWPSLEVFFHGGVNFDPYRKQYKEIIGFDGLNYMNIYNASEGYFGIQDQAHSDEMLLMLDSGVFYEFIPLDEIEKENPKIIPLQGVEIGKNYALVISTNSGLWRYKIGDTVVFTSTTPYRIRISGRTKNFINACGEEVIIDNAIKALQAACEKASAIVLEYTGAPLFSDSSTCHEWLIEFEKEPENLGLFIDTFDQTLQSVNSDYEAKRYKDFVLQKPLFKILPQGTFYKWLESKKRLGGQYKIPRLSNDRKYVSEIESILKEF